MKGYEFVQVLMMVCVFFMGGAFTLNWFHKEKPEALFTAAAALLVILYTLKFVPEVFK